VYEETPIGRPHDTSVQKATSDNENVDAVVMLGVVAYTYNPATWRLGSHALDADIWNS